MNYSTNYVKLYRIRWQSSEVYIVFAATEQPRDWNEISVMVRQFIILIFAFIFVVVNKYIIIECVLPASVRLMRVPHSCRAIVVLMFAANMPSKIVRCKSFESRGTFDMI